MPKRDMGGKESVPRMLQMAFKSAAEADEEKAWSFWRSAINRGYTVQPKTERQLRITIEKAKRDRGIQ